MPTIAEYEQSFTTHTNESLESIISGIDALMNDDVIADGYSTLSTVRALASNELCRRE